MHVGLANENGYPHTGAVDFLDNQVNPTIGTVRARAVLPNADRIFTPGLYARVQFVSGQKAQVLLIDDKAILTDQDRKYVYAVDKDGKAQRKDIVLGSMVDGIARGPVRPRTGRQDRRGRRTENLFPRHAGHAQPRFRWAGRRHRLRPQPWPRTRETRPWTFLNSSSIGRSLRLCCRS